MGDSRKRRRADEADVPKVEWTELQRVWLKRVQKLFEGNGPPRPGLELKRHEEVMRLRTFLSRKYAQLMDEIHDGQIRGTSELSESQALPREAFNRWLMERINAGGRDPLLGGQASSTDLLNAAAEGLERDLCGPFLRSESPRDALANFASKVQSLCLELANEADAAAERVRVIASSFESTANEKVSATLNAKRGCYVFSLDIDNPTGCKNDLRREADVESESGSDGCSPTFTLSPSALARLAWPLHVCAEFHSLPHPSYLYGLGRYSDTSKIFKANSVSGCIRGLCNTYRYLLSEVCVTLIDTYSIL